ncbi:type VI secretion system baseplate subunit TssF [Morganella psychrotolerans]|uniref:type VI secretion system baseplate subunit TssF n=1 Tax=Morganella psychrotolerans TaxID=368603 RepID=UPI0039AF91BF
MPRNPYFSDELEYLQLLESTVARYKPHLVNFLAEKSTDPDVLRLLEGFAYLSASLRGQIERQFPELTNSLVTMLWPGYPRPFPSMTIMQLTPDARVNQPCLIPAGTLFESREITFAGSDSEDDKIYHPVCHFTQCRDARVVPFTVSGTDSDTQSITLHFTFTGTVKLSEAGLNRLRIYLDGDDYSARELYYRLNNAITGATLATEKHTFTPEKLSVSPVGFRREDALLPYPKNSYEGHRLLQEYFSFPQAFLFLDIEGLDDIPPVMTGNQCSLTIRFSRPLPLSIAITPETIRINCVPAANLFVMDSEAIELNGKQSEYPLSPCFAHAQCYDIFSVRRVDGLRRCGHLPAQRTHYTQFESFHHQNQINTGNEDLYYRLRILPTTDNEGFRHRISFVRSNEHELTGCDEIISVSLNCTNRDIAGCLSTGMINRCITPLADLAGVTNIIKPTKTLLPLLDHSLHWSMLTNLSLNYQSLLNLDSLRELLQLYDLTSVFHQQTARQTQKCLDALVSMETKPVEYLYRGLPVRGLKSTLSVYQNAFSSEGDLYLFCSVIAHFFELYTSVNTFHELEVINMDNRETYLWPANINQSTLI